MTPSRRTCFWDTFPTTAPSVRDQRSPEYGRSADYASSARPPGPITAGSPVYVNGSPLGSFFGIDPNIRTPYVQNWNVNIQQAFGNKTTVEVGYVGSKGTDCSASATSISPARRRSRRTTRVRLAPADSSFPIVRLPASTAAATCPERRIRISSTSTRKSRAPFPPTTRCKPAFT